MTPFLRARTGRLPPVCPRRGRSPTRYPGEPAETPAFRVSAVPRPVLPRRNRVALRFWKPTAGRWRRRRRRRCSRKLRRGSNQPASRSCRGRKAQRCTVEAAIHGTELSTTSSPGSRWLPHTARATANSASRCDLAAQAEALTLDDYRRDIKERDRRRAVYRALAAEFDACLTLSAPGAAPVGLGWTGDPAFVIPGSMLGVPAISLPVLQDGGLPLGLQLLGFADADAALFSTAGGVLALFAARLTPHHPPTSRATYPPHRPPGAFPLSEATSS